MSSTNPEICTVYLPYTYSRAEVVIRQRTRTIRRIYRSLDRVERSVQRHSGSWRHTFEVYMDATLTCGPLPPITR